MCFSLLTKYSFSIRRLFFLEIPKYQFTDGIKFINTRPVPAGFEINFLVREPTGD